MVGWLFSASDRDEKKADATNGVTTLEAARLAAADRQYNRAIESIKRYNMAEDARYDLFLKTYNFPKRVRTVGWFIIIVLNILSVIAIMIYGMRMDTVYDNYNNSNIASNCSATSYPGIDISTQEYLSYNATERYLGLLNTILC